VISIFTGHIPPNMSNTEVYDAVDDVDILDNYLRQTYEALMPYFRIDTDNKLLTTLAKETEYFNEV
jgi:type II secretory pathway component PulK